MTQSTHPKTRRAPSQMNAWFLEIAFVQDVIMYACILAQAINSYIKLSLLNNLSCFMGFIYIGTTPAVNNTDSLDNGMHCKFRLGKAILAVYLTANVVFSVVHCKHYGVFPLKIVNLLYGY